MTVTYLIRNFLATMTALAELWNIIATDHMKLTTVSTVRNANQNHIKTYIFSLMILIGSTHWNENSVKLDKLDEYDISVICFILNDENKKKWGYLSIMILDCSRRTILLKSTFCNTRENFRHWVNSFFVLKSKYHKILKRRKTIK